jgi:hypothetical protein
MIKSEIQEAISQEEDRKSIESNETKKKTKKKKGTGRTGEPVVNYSSADETKEVETKARKKEGEKSTKSIRDFNDEGCVLTMEVTGTDVVCVQTFKRL